MDTSKSPITSAPSHTPTPTVEGTGSLKPPDIVWPSSSAPKIEKHGSSDPAYLEQRVPPDISSRLVIDAAPESQQMHNIVQMLAQRNFSRLVQEYRLQNGGESNCDFQLGSLARFFFGDGFERLINDSHNTLGELSTNVNTVLAQATGMLGSLSDTVKPTAVLLQCVAAVGLACLIHHLAHKVGTVRALIVASIIGGSFTAFAARDSIKNTIVAAIDAVRKYFEPQSADLQLQAGLGDTTSTVGSVSMFVLLSAFLIGVVPKHSSIAKFLSRVDEAGKSAKGYQALLGFIEPAVQQVVDLYKFHVGIEVDPDDAVGLWCRDYERLTGSLDFEHKLQNDVETFEKFMRIFHASTELRSNLRSMTAAEQRMFCSYQSRLFRYFDMAAKSSVGLNALRPVPLTILLKGDTGIGKSSITNFLMFDVFREIIEEYAGKNDKISAIYSRNTEQEYWDSYNGQPIIGVDDAFQINDSVQNPDPIIFELIRMTNSWPYFLHMAKVEQKDNTILNAKGIVMTANHWPLVNSIRHTEAFLRRLHVCAEVVVKEKYLKRGIKNEIDFAAALADQGSNAFPIVLDMYEFRIVDPINPQEVLAKFAYPDFVQYCRDYAARLRKETGGFAHAAKFYFENGGISNFEQIKETYVAQSGGDEDEEYTSASEDFEEPEPSYQHVACGNYHPWDRQYRIHNERSTTRRLLEYGTRGLKGRYERIKELIKEQYEAAFTAFRDNLREQGALTASETTTSGLVSGTDLALSPRARILRIFEVFSDKYRSLKDIIIEQPLVSGTLAALTTMAVIGVLIKTYVTWANTEEDEDAPTTGQVEQHIEVRMPSLYEELPDHNIETYDIQDAYERGRLQSKEVRTHLNRRHKLVPQSKEVRTPKGRLYRIQNRNIADSPVEVSLCDEEEQDLPDDNLLTLEESEEQEDALLNEQLYAVEGTMMTTDGPGDRMLTEETMVLPEGELISEDTVRNQTFVHSGNDLQSFQLQRKLALQIMSVQILDKNRKAYHIGNTIGVRNLLVLMNDHIYRTVVSFSTEEKFEGEDMPIRLASHNMALTCEFKLKEVQAVAKVKGVDAVLVQLPASKPRFPDILKHFITREEAGAFKKTEGSLLAISATPKKRLVSEMHHLPIVKAADTEIVAVSKRGGDVQISSRSDEVYKRGAYTYGGTFQYGDCGALLFARNTRLKSKILGFHAAWAQSRQIGVAVALFREDLLAAAEQIDPTFVIQGFGFTSGYVSEYLPKNLDCIVPGEFISIGSAKPVGTASKTQLHPSLFFERVTKATTAPAHLRKFQTTSGIVIDPIKRGLAKAGHPDMPVPQEDLDIVCEEVYGVYFNRKFAVPQELDNRGSLILTFEEAVTGFPGDSRFPSINRAGSCGYPFVLNDEIRRLKKRYFFGDEDVFDLDNDRARDLKRQVEEREAMCRKGIRPDTVWLDLAKDERRDLAKVAVGKTRMFVCGPIDYNILFTQWFGAARACVNQYYLDNESAIGVNPYSTDWELLHMKLRQKGDKVIAGDFTNFDGMTKAQFLWKELEMINRFYRTHDLSWTKEHDLIRTMIFLDIVNSVHLCGEYVYQWTHSLPSGCAMTSQLNTINNSIIMRLAYRWAAQKWSKGDIGLFNNNVSMIAFGDDNVLNISDRVTGWFNQETITQVLADYDITYTDETKSATVNLTRSLSEVEFLKRKFRFDEIVQRHVAPLRPDVIYEMVNWVRNPRDIWSQTLDNLKVAIGEASLHGKDFYDKFKRAFDPLLAEHDIEFVIPPFKDAHHQTLESNYYGIDFVAQAYCEVSSLPKTASAINSLSDRASSRTVRRNRCRNNSSLTSLSGAHKTQGAWRKPVILIAQSNSMDNQQTTNPNPDNNVTTQETIQFVDASLETGISTLTDPLPLQQEELRETILETRTHEIENFLARPVKLGTFKYQTSNLQNDSLATYNFPEAYTTNTMYLEKLMGFVAFRGTLKVDIYSNAQPFQTGLVRAAYIPNAQAMSVKAASLVGNICSFTTLPNVSCLLPETTSFSIEFPFVSNHTGVNMITGEGEFGRLYIHAVTPLRSFGVTDVNFTVFVSLKDAVFEFPTGAPVATKFLSSRQRLAFKLLLDPAINIANIKEHLEMNFEPEDWAAVRAVPEIRMVEQPPLVDSDDDGDDFRLQAGGVKISAKPNAENSLTDAPLAGVGTITKSLLAFSGISGALALIPTLAPVAAPVAMVSGALGGVSALFGWSKSTNLGDTTYVKPIAARGMPNANGQDNSTMLAMCAGNSLDQDPSVFGTELDEMSFSVMASTPAVVNTVTWSTAHIADDSLLSIPVTPCLLYRHNMEEVALPMMAYVQNCFSMWRGSINYIFTVPATKYHKGRLRFTFVPGYRGTTLAGVDVGKCYSSILDIQESNVIHLNVPYISTADWMYADFESNFPQSGIYPDESSVTGTLFLQVLNPLVAPDTVSNLVDIVVEVCAGPDMRRAVPRSPLYLPSTSVTTVQSEKHPNNDTYRAQSVEWVAQAGDSPTGPIALTRNDYQSGKVPPCIGGAKGGDPTSFKADRMCTGETILSARTFMKRFTKIYENLLPRASTDTTFYSVLPFGKFSPITPSYSGFFDDYSYWSYPFAFARGSMRFKIKWSTLDTSGNVGAPTGLEIKELTDPNGSYFGGILGQYTATDGPVKVVTGPLGTAFPYSGTSIAHYSDQNLEGATEISIPFYNRFHTIPLEISQAPTVDNCLKGDFPPIMLLFRAANRAAAGYVDVWRAIGDDFSLGYLCGSPLMRSTLV